MTTIPPQTILRGGMLTHQRGHVMLTRRVAVIQSDGAGTRDKRTVNVLPFPGPSLDASTVPP